VPKGRATTALAPATGPIQLGRGWLLLLLPQPIRTGLPGVGAVTVGLEEAGDFEGAFFALAQSLGQEPPREALHLELVEQLHQVCVLLVEVDELLLQPLGHGVVVVVVVGAGGGVEEGEVRRLLLLLLLMQALRRHGVVGRSSRVAAASAAGAAARVFLNGHRFGGGRAECW
jgi:hypothetical protein